MITNQISILVIAPLGRLRDSLAVILKSSAEFSIVGQASDGQAGLQLLRTHQPEVVILAAETPDDSNWPALDHLQSLAPQSQFLTLTPSNPQQAQTKTAATHQLHVENLTAENLTQAIHALLSPDPM